MRSQLSFEPHPFIVVVGLEGWSGGGGGSTVSSDVTKGSKVSSHEPAAACWNQSIRAEDYLTLVRHTRLYSHYSQTGLQGILL